MRFSKVFSILLHPIFMPIIVLVISLHQVDYFQFIFADKEFYLYLTVAIFTIILPLILMIYFVRSKKIESFEMKTIKERRTPLFMISIVILTGMPFFKNFSKLAPILTAIYISAFIILMIAYIITKRWKISLHMLGIGGATGICIAINYIYGGMYYWSLLFFLLSGLLGYSRLNEEAHNHLQIYSGYLLGVFFQVIFILNYNLIISIISIFRSSIASML